MVNEDTYVLKDCVKKYCISVNYTIQEAIEKIDTAKERAVIVLNSACKVIGMISQGDIIRALLGGCNLYTRISNFVRPNFYYLNEHSLDEAVVLFKERRITLLPVVDEQFMLLDVITIYDIFGYLEMKAHE